MEIKSKAGYVFEIEVNGTQEQPVIQILPFEVQDRRIEGKATIGRYNQDSEDMGLYVGKGFIRLEKQEIDNIKTQIDILPHRAYYATKEQEIVSVDGENVNIGKWHFDKLMKTKKGTIIMESQMEHFLDAKNIFKIKITEAIRMWVEEKEEEHITAEAKGVKYAKAIFDDDEMEVGYAQACENAGIPHYF